MKARFLSLALGLIATLALLAGSGATAASAQPSSLAQPTQCELPNSGCFLENLWNGGLLINGYAHGARLFGEPWPTAIGYSYVQEDGLWGLMKANISGLCWNESGQRVYLDSCHSLDHNELFAFVRSGNYWLIKNYALGTGLNLAAAHAGTPLYFTSGVNDTSLWSGF
jgi:hypothetical protein